MKEYEIKEIRGLEWHELGDNKYLLKNVLDENRIKKYVDDEWYRNGCEVRHNDNVREKFDWDKSYIKNIVLENFKKI